MTLYMGNLNENGRPYNNAVLPKNAEWILNLLKEKGPLSSAELSKITHLARSCIINNTIILYDKDLIEKTGNLKSRKYKFNPKPEPLSQMLE